MKLSDLKVDPDRIEQGAWIDNIPEMGELRLKVRGINNSDYRRMQSKLLAAVPRQKRLGGFMDPEEQDRVISMCLHATVLLDWDGIQAEDGTPIPYSKELAKDLMTMPEFQRIRTAVLYAANQVAEERAIDTEVLVGN